MKQGVHRIIFFGLRFSDASLWLVRSERAVLISNEKIHFIILQMSVAMRE